MTGSRSYALGLVAALMLLTSCSASSDSPPKPSLEDVARQSLSTLAGVTSVDAHQEPVTKAISNRSDPDDWSLDIDVVMADNATADQVVTAAGATHTFIKDHIGSAPWVAHLRVGAITAVPVEDRTTSSAVQIDIYPVVRRSATEDARDAMALKAIDRVTSVAITNKQVSVHVANAKDLNPVFDQVRALPVWKDGGILLAETGQVKLSDVPARITAAQAHAFFRASAACPEADFAIESSGQNPEVYVNHVTASQARAIISSFTNPALARTNADGFVLEFNIRAFEGSGTRDTHGTFGERS